MPSDRKINYLELPAADFGSVKAFYESVFDWQFTDYGSEYTAFNDGFIDGGFFKSDLVSTTENGAALIVLYADDLEAVLQTVVDAGGTICKPIFSFPGGRRFQFHDPHGNELAVWSDS